MFGAIQLRGCSADRDTVNSRLMTQTFDVGQAERVIAEVTAPFGQAFHNAPIGMALVGPDGVWLAVNASLCAILGYDAPELLLLTFQDVTHPDDLDRDLELLDEVIGGVRETYSMEKRYLHRTGRTVWVDLSVSMVKSPEGAPQYFVAQIQDITRRKAGEERLAAYAMRLAASNRELVEFASVAAHDLAEPLRVIEGYLHLLESRHASDLDDDARRFIGHAVDGAERMQHLIDDLLTYSRATESVGPPALVDLDDVVSNSLSSLERLIGDADAVVSIGELPSIWGSQRRLHQLFQNLIANAVKFSDPDRRPQIRVDARREGGGWRVSVSDNGIGIPAEHRERIFGMFKRLHSREAYAGTGIGLAICRKVAESHGGRIWVGDAASGTVIHVSFPDRSGGDMVDAT